LEKPVVGLSYADEGHLESRKTPWSQVKEAKSSEQGTLELWFGTWGWSC
jgi:hypothetical protein